MFNWFRKRKVENKPEDVKRVRGSNTSAKDWYKGLLDEKYDLCWNWFRHKVIDLAKDIGNDKFDLSVDLGSSMEYTDSYGNTETIRLLWSYSDGNFHGYFGTYSSDRYMMNHIDREWLINNWNEGCLIKYRIMDVIISAKRRMNRENMIYEGKINRLNQMKIP